LEIAFILSFITDSHYYTLFVGSCELPDINYIYSTQTQSCWNRHKRIGILWNLLQV